MSKFILHIKNIWIPIFLSIWFSITFVYLETNKYNEKSINEMYFRYTSLVDKQVSQKWFKTAAKFNATYAIERQLQSFSDDFFEKGILHHRGKIIGGFGILISDEIPNIGKISGAFLDNGRFYYRSVSDKDLAVTFLVSNKFIKHKFPSIIDYFPANKSGGISVRTSILHAISDNIIYFIFLFTSFASIIFITIYVVSSFRKIKEEADQQKLKNHDLRSNEFKYQTIVYWANKYLSNPNEVNKKSLCSEISDISLSIEINKRIFSSGISTGVSKFYLHGEIEKIKKFVGLENEISHLRYIQCSKNLCVEGELNSFTVILINLLKNSLREICGTPGNYCDLHVFEAPKYVELIVSNDGVIEHPFLILKKSRSFRNSTGVGLTIIQQEEKRFGSCVTMRSIPEKNKVVCSFSIRKAFL